MLSMKEVYNELLDTPYAKMYRDDYIYVKCPICGDSRKHEDKPHCSIWIKPDQPLIYHCWICESSGIVDHTFLSDLGIHRPDIFTSVAIYNKKNSTYSDGQSKFISARTGKDIKVPKLRTDGLYKEKIEYVGSKRLGVDIDPKVLEYMKCIVSIKDFLKLNSLEPNENWKKSINIIEKDYVGFLTHDKTYIVLRSIRRDPKMRYIKYPVFNGVNLGVMYYTIPMKVDILHPEITLCITEGIFDILGVLYHVKKKCLDNTIYAAVCGSGYNRVLKEFFVRGFLTNLNVEIFSDSDKDTGWYKSTIENLKFWCSSMSIYYNTRAKDFGVHKDLIMTAKVVM